MTPETIYMLYGLAAILILVPLAVFKIGGAIAEGFERRRD